MATTSLWRVHGWLGKVVVYVENPNKTENPKCFELPDMTERQAQGLADVIEYAADEQKTTTPMQQFVSGVNCTPVTARDSMMRVKREFEKEGGVVAYHGFQSFAPGEVTPEVAHEIGLRLARQLWGSRFQVLVATHLDKSSHIHTHFVINTVSHIDGKKFHRTRQDYRAMQRASDELCREYGLSVIEHPELGTSKHYGEWNAERSGKPTFRTLIKADIDRAIAMSVSERQFFENLRKLGYSIKFGQDITLCPAASERGLKLRRNFGEDYTIESIRRRILSHPLPKRTSPPPARPQQRYHVRGQLKTFKRSTGLRALYFYYLYRIGALPKRQPNQKRVYVVLREDIRFIRTITQETRLLVTHSIDTAEQLSAFKQSRSEQMTVLSGRRKMLYRKLRRVTETDKETVRSEIAELTKQIGVLRREVKLCEDIEVRSGVMTDKLRRVNEAEKTKTKEVMKHDQFRRSR